ncbi:MAG: electron transfer flavoprotein [Spirochaetes bacterium]|nr:MAG: electron transfer flavoprotein [Spirochaetota bacterium]RLA91336.1 MAG: electron transfer flavoprotein [Deltaproteobacteria bacterium]
MEKVDVVIVGGGLAGLSAAYNLVEKGKEVILIERGDFSGSKNVTGGRIYLSPIRDLLPDIFDEAPFERHVTKEILTFIDNGRSTSLEFTSKKWDEKPYHSCTLLRARFDKWVADKVIEKGGFVIPQKRVDDLLFEDGNKVVGVKVGDEEILAHIVIAADGVLSFMAQKAGLRKPLNPNNYAVGIKEVLALNEKLIEDRFGLLTNQGAANLFVGSITKGIFGGGFLYTNKDTLSLGLVIGLESFMKKDPKIEAFRLIEEFEKIPEINPLIKDAEIKEYSAHVISEGGINNLSKLYGDGIMVVGDAAGFSLNMGITVRGMEFAIASGVMAAEVAFKALKKGDTSKETLKEYEKLLKESFLFKDMQTFRHSKNVLENPRFYNFYPSLICSLLEKLFTFNNIPKERIFKTLSTITKKNLFNMKGIKDFLLMRKI